MRRSFQILGLVVFLAVCFAVAGIGSLFTAAGMMGRWFDALPRPSWNPPNWLFGPVWTVLYTLMAIAGWLVWRERGGLRQATVPMALFAIQLALNLGWTGIFFYQRAPGAAFGEIVLLWLAILATMIVFWRVKSLAGWLFMPYLLWVTYAATLNYAIWRAL